MLPFESPSVLDSADPLGRPNLFWSGTGLLPLRSEYYGQKMMQYANRQRSARSLEWQCLWSCMGTMAWCAADFRATQPRQLGAARSDFDPGSL
jgi:hypothetical protein